MEKAVDLELLQGLWKMYLRQKGEETDVGVDTAPDIDRMRNVLNLAARGVLTDDEIEARFPDKPRPHKTGVCPMCDNTGSSYTRKAQLRSRNSVEGQYRHTTAPAILLCECFEGKRIREAIRKGPQRKKRGSRG